MNTPAPRSDPTVYVSGSINGSAIVFGDYNIVVVNNSTSPASATNSFDRSSYLSEAQSLSLARSANRARSAGLTDEQTETVLESVRSTAPKELGEFPQPGRILGITAPLGGGKSEVAEWWLRSKISDARTANFDRLPVWIDVKRQKQSISLVLETFAAIPGVSCLDIVLDGLDEVSASDSAEAIEIARAFLAGHAGSFLVATARSQTMGLDFDDCKSLNGLELAESVDLYAALTGRNGGSVYGWPQAVRDALRWPLWVALSVEYDGRRAPNGGADIIKWLVDRAIKKPREVEALTSAEAFTRITAVARESVESHGRVRASSAGSLPEQHQLLATGLLALDSDDFVFPLAIIEQWLAGNAVKDGTVIAATYAKDCESIARWRYPLAVALQLSSDSKADEVLRAVCGVNWLLGRWVLQAAELNLASASGSPVRDIRPIASRIYSATKYIGEHMEGSLVRPIPLFRGGHPLRLFFRSHRSSITFGWILARAEDEAEPYVILGEGSHSSSEEDIDYYHMTVNVSSPSFAWQCAFDLVERSISRSISDAARSIDSMLPSVRTEVQWDFIQSLVGNSTGVLRQRSVASKDISLRCARIAELLRENEAEEIDLGGYVLDCETLEYLARYFDQDPAFTYTCPHPAPDLTEFSFDTQGFYSDERLRELVQWTYETALAQYYEMCEGWFPNSADVLGLRSIGGIRILGTVRPASRPSNENRGLPGVQYVVNPTASVDDRSQVRFLLKGSDTGSFTARSDAEVSELRAWLVDHPQRAPYVRFTRMTSVLRMHQRMPAAKVAFAWMLEDLKRLGFKELKSPLRD